MKSDELMIGDWVKTPIDIENGAYVYDIDRISSINEYDEFSTSEFDMCGDVADLLPVPLTAEILEKNGFIKRKANFTPDWCWYVLTNNCFLEDRLKDAFHFNGSNSMKLKCVHELQHALKLCGIDKTIEL